jgi:predicted transcriptional regulator
MKVLLSIKPKYAERIFSGEKKFEYRRVVWNKYGINKVVVYASAPVSMVIGEFKVAHKLCKRRLNLAELWWYTYKDSGITFEEFLEYFTGKPNGYAIAIKEPKLYDKPRPLSDYGIKRPPQNFMYLTPPRA